MYLFWCVVNIALLTSRNITPHQNSYIYFHIQPITYKYLSEMFTCFCLAAGLGKHGVEWELAVARDRVVDDAQRVHLLQSIILTVTLEHKKLTCHRTVKYISYLVMSQSVIIALWCSQSLPFYPFCTQVIFALN